MTFIPETPMVWSEIPVTDMTKAMAFYKAVTDMEFELIENMGPNPFAIFKRAGSGVSGHLYPGKPAGDGTGPTVHLMVDGDLEEKMERVAKAGGTVLSEPVAIPAGRFAYFNDPDGNSMALFELSADAAA